MSPVLDVSLICLKYMKVRESMKVEELFLREMHTPDGLCRAR